jgi:hypothetical protein
MDFLANFALTSVSGRIPQLPALNALAPLEELPGTWKGTGFNQIWRPFHGTQDRFLELNETLEQLQFDKVPGDIPNRGLLQSDINLHGLRYLQQIQDKNVLGPNGEPAGIHVEPGLWLTVPATSNPQDPPTIARLASIPHGTALVAQGTALPDIDGPPVFAPVSITPFVINQPQNTVSFPETNLGVPTQFRTPSTDIAGVTQAIVNNPNIVLASGIAGKHITHTRVLRISTVPANPPSSGGGTANIAFLQGAAPGPNALDVRVDAIFWIEKFIDAHDKPATQLQYSQIVLLNFNGLSWPHVSVATLVKQ